MKLVRCKIDAGNCIQTDKVQRQLFEMGYKWRNGKNEIITCARYLFLTEAGEMTYGEELKTFIDYRTPVGKIVVAPTIEITPSAYLDAGNYTVDILKQILTNLEKSDA